MPTEKIKDIEPPCLDPAHHPPSMQVFEPGTYKHTCPKCGYETIFFVPHVVCGHTPPGTPQIDYSGKRPGVRWT